MRGNKQVSPDSPEVPFEETCLDGLLPRAYKRIKVVEILAAAIIPFLAALGRPHIGMVTGGLGVLITVLEGMLHLNQYQQNWINYRST